MYEIEINSFLIVADFFNKAENFRAQCMNRNQTILTKTYMRSLYKNLL